MNVDELIAKANRTTARSATSAASVDDLLRMADAASAPPAEPPPSSFSAMRMLGNIPQSAGNFAMSAGHALMHPVDTASAMGNTMLGYGEMAGSALGLPVSQGSVPYAQAMNQQMGQRYGSVPQALHTLQEDPFGAALDASALFGGAGALAKGAGMAAKVGGATRTAAALDKLGQGASLTSKVAALPVTAAPLAVAKGAKMAARGSYGGSLKMGTTVDIPTRQAIITEGLARRSVPTPQGVAKIGRLKSQVGTKISQIIDTHPANDIPTDAIFKGLRDLKKEYKVPSPESAGNRARIDAIEKAYQAEIGDRTSLSRKEVWDMRKAIDKEIWNKKSLVDPTVTKENEAYRALRNSEQGQLTTRIPELNAPSAEYSKLSDLQLALDRAANRTENFDPLGIITAMFGVGGASTMALMGANPLIGLGAAAIPWALRGRNLARTSIGVDRLGRLLNPMAYPGSPLLHAGSVANGLLGPGPYQGGPGGLLK